MYWSCCMLLVSVEIGLISGEWLSKTGNLKGHTSDQLLLSCHFWYVLHKETGNFIIGLGSKKKKKRNKRKRKITLELGVFVDQIVHHKLQSMYLTEEKINNVILGLINQIDAIFNQPKFDPKVNLIIKYLEIFKEQPEELKMEDNLEAFDVLTTFCNYQMKRNTKLSKLSQWNMALYFTGKDLFTIYNGTKSTGTMGLSAIDGICKEQHACVIAEFVSVSSTGHPYLSSGWMASYIMAHEMGHNLGMLHDGYGNNCSKDGFLMSATRSFQGETTWSECSASTLKRIQVKCLNIDKPRKPTILNDHMKFNLVPGLTWNANDQCKLFLMDGQAKQITIPIQDVCNSIKCVSKKRVGYYYAGPALDGTYCGPQKWCKSGKCVPNDREIVSEGHWSDWKILKSCTSSCLVKAKGTIVSQRRCNEPKRSKNRKMAAVCDGPDFRVELCDDSIICGNEKRRLVESIANEKCAEYSKILTSKDLTSKGGQMPYSKNRKWQSCAIFCKTKGGVWYTPRFDVNGMDGKTTTTHLPDGTWCHVDVNHQDYYCLSGECILETSFQTHSV